MTRSVRGLPERLRRHWGEHGFPSRGARVVVACSGGLDSLVLLHLLRFPLQGLGLRVEAAHFDHRMRPASGRDAAWVRGLAAAWGVPLHEGIAREVPTGEEGARRARYAFLSAVARRTEGEGGTVLTAHHADDQAETVLFRMLRGTGVRGLAGIPRSRGGWLVRPLLPFTRSELEDYARGAGLRGRPDPTNRSPLHQRNRIRHEVLPLLESIRPGARRALLRLARNAADAEELVQRVGAGRLEALLTAREGGSALLLDRQRWLAEDPALRPTLLRLAVERLGGSLSQAGTDAALRFMQGTGGAGELRLAGGVVIERTLDGIRLAREGVPPPPSGGMAPVPGSGRPDRERSGRVRSDDRPLPIPAPGPGQGVVGAGGAGYRVCWGEGALPGASSPHGARWSAEFDPGELRFPLELRGWRPGDRTRTPGGRKKLKKVWLEHRVPRERRATLPLLVDAGGEVLWIPGVHRAPLPGGAWAIQLTPATGAAAELGS